MKLALILLNYKDAETTVRAAKRAESFSVFDHIIVVDNASGDGSSEYIEKTLGIRDRKKTDVPGVTLISSHKNGGYGCGNGLGIKYAFERLGAELALIANPDAVFSEELVFHMKEIFESGRERFKKPGAVGAVMRAGKSTAGPGAAGTGGSISYSEFILSGWKERGLLGEVINSAPLLKRIFRGAINYPESYYRSLASEGSPGCGACAAENAVSVYAVHGSLVMLDAEAFLKAGGFDEDIFLYMEEYVLGARLKKAGYETLLLRESYEHEGSHSISGSGMKAVERQKNRQKAERIYYRKYLGAGILKMAAVRAVQAAVLAETVIAARLGLLH